MCYWVPHTSGNTLKQPSAKNMMPGAGRRLQLLGAQCREGAVSEEMTFLELGDGKRGRWELALQVEWLRDADVNGWVFLLVEIKLVLPESLKRSAPPGQSWMSQEKCHSLRWPTQGSSHSLTGVKKPYLSIFYWQWKGSEFLSHVVSLLTVNTLSWMCLWQK